jgi:hypothetical protein
MRVREDIGLVVVSTIAAVGIGFLITRWFVSKLMARRNWMRILLASSTALLVVVTVALLNRTVSRYSSSLPDAIAFGSQVVLYSAAVLLLFTARSRSWFAAGRSVASDSVANSDSTVRT